MPAYNYSSTAGEYTLTGDITASATAVTLNGVVGLPAVPFKVVLDPGTNDEEIVKVTNVAGNTLTVERGHDSTVAVTHSALTSVRHMLTAEDLRLSRQHEDATSGVHGVTGDLVGVDDAQAFTNKDLTDPTNTFPATLATLAGAETFTNKTLNAPVITGSGATAERLYITNTLGTTWTPLNVKGILGQSANLTSWRDSTDAVIASVDASGNITAPNITAHTDATDAHGATGAVVGTTNTQTLTNKNLTSATNSFPATLATTAATVSHAEGGAKKMKWWRQDLTFSAGDCVITHGLGTTPVNLQLTANPGTNLFTLGVKLGSIGATTFTARCVAMSSGGVVSEYTGSLTDVHILAIG